MERSTLLFCCPPCVRLGRYIEMTLMRKQARLAPGLFRYFQSSERSGCASGLSGSCTATPHQKAGADRSDHDDRHGDQGTVDDPGRGDHEQTDRQTRRPSTSTMFKPALTFWIAPAPGRPKTSIEG
jgi:hypothetical protein